MNRDDILDKYKNNKLFAATILDKIIKYQKSKKNTYTNFLNPIEFNIAISILNKLKVKYYEYNHDDILDRKTISIGENDFSYIKLIKIINKSSKELLHKDYMGALYNCGIKEDNIGDIFVIDNYAIVFIIDKMVDYIIYNLPSVGSNNVLVEKVDINDVNISTNIEEVSFTVASLRIDSIIAKHFKMSRSQAVDIINKKSLFINNNLLTNNSYLLKEQDVISLRRFGKFKYISSKVTKKDKMLITIMAYK